MKATLITGASGGIGEAFARRLAAEKHDLVVVARSEGKLSRLCEELAEKHGVTARYIAVELVGHDADRQVLEETKRLGVEVDWLINNAGFGSMGDFVQLDLARELEMIDLNVRCLVALTHRFIGGMRDRRRGTIINVSSAAGFQPVPFMATYAATKAFVTSFSEAVAEENRPFDIQVLALCPGPTETNFHAAADMDPALSMKGFQSVDDVIETAMKAIGTGRMKVVSGWTNWLVSTATNFVPDSLITRVVARGMRGNFQKDQADPGPRR